MLEMLDRLVHMKMRHQHCYLDPSCFHQLHRLHLHRHHIRRPLHQLHIQFRQHRQYRLYRQHHRHRLREMHLRHRLVRQYRLRCHRYQQHRQWSRRQIRH